MAHKATKPRSAQRGNAPSPYTKYEKAPYDYRTMYQRLLNSGAKTPLASHLRAMRRTP